MLTEEEIMSIRNRAKLSDNRQIDIIPFARQVERAVIDKLSKQPEMDQVYSLMVDLASALYACAQAGSVNECDIIKQGDKTHTISDLIDRAESEIVKRNSFASKKYSQPAIDLNANERGEPDVIYLQLHDPDDIDVTQVADYMGDGVTWCWERIHANDVRYVRADLVVKK